MAADEDRFLATVLADPTVREILARAPALTGVCQVTAHPLVQEADRLEVLMWMPVVLGLPLIVDRYRAVRPVPGPG